MSFGISTVGGGRDPRLDTHRTAIPIDHPDLSITRAKLEYPTANVKLIYLAMIDKAIAYGVDGTAHANYYATTDSFADLAVELWTLRVYDDSYRKLGAVVRLQNAINLYQLGLTGSALGLIKRVNDNDTVIAAYTLSTGVDVPRLLKLSVSGSTLKGFQANIATPKITATDSTFASGKFGCKMPSSSAYYISDGAWGFTSATLRSPSSPSPPAQAIVELDVEGSGKPSDPFRPLLSKNLAEITSLTGLPDFLYQEAKKYQLLRNKGFTDEEIQVLLGYIPQHQVDLDSVTWGAFEFHPDKASTAIIITTGNNPYNPGAIDRQKARAKRVFTVSNNYSDAIALYNQLKRDYPHWLAGKDDFAYQILGWEELDLMQNVDFYHGELIEHKTHYQQLNQVPDFEIRNRLNELADKLSRISVLTDERDKHLAKIKEINRLGW
jgi:hypothetical protein